MWIFADISVWVKLIDIVSAKDANQHLINRWERIHHNQHQLDWPKPKILALSSFFLQFPRLFGTQSSLNIEKSEWTYYTLVSSILILQINWYAILFFSLLFFLCENDYSSYQIDDEDLPLESLLPSFYLQ